MFESKASCLIKNIVENMQCGFCNKLKGNIVRYKCGHISCEDCAEAVNECVKCYTNDLTVSDKKYIYDPVYTNQVKCTEDLLNSFQKAFNVNVDKQQKLSVQQKIEKKIFPECIQAERKYYNKRKTSINESRPKSLPFEIPGEAVTSTTFMNNKMDFVEKWLERNVKDQPKRYALNDLDVNSPRKIKKNSTVLKNNSPKLENSLTFKFSDNKNEAIDDFFKYNYQNEYLNNYDNKIPLGAIQHDSAIFSEDDEAIVVEDSQTKQAYKLNLLSNNSLLSSDSRQRDNKKIIKNLFHKDETVVIDDTASLSIDKDKEALLAVLAADKNVIKSELSHYKYSDIHKPDKKNLKKQFQRVPFLNKKYSTNIQSEGDYLIKCVKLPITIETKDLSVTISEVDIDDLSNIKQQSRGVQTEFDETILKPIINNKPQNNNCDRLISTNRNSTEDIFTDEDIIDQQDIIQNNKSNDKSDSDSATIKFQEVTVVADIHTPCSQIFSRSLLRDLKVSTPKPRKKRFIASSDSSEKENKDPNVRRGIAKKYKKKNKKKH